MRDFTTLRIVLLQFHKNSDYAKSVQKICVQHPFDADGLEIMEQIERLAGGSVGDGSLAELRGMYPARATCTEQGGNVYGGGSQQSDSTLFSKIQKKNKVLQQVRQND